MEIRFTDDALADLRRIARDGLDATDPMFADRYLAAIDAALDRMTIYPAIGPAADEIAAGLRAYTVRPFRIFYRVRADAIIVLRILHHRMDASPVGNVDR